MINLLKLKIIFLMAICLVTVNLGILHIDQAKAAELSAEEIINRANYSAYYQAKDGRAQVKMTITDNKNNSRSRKMTILRRDITNSDDLGSNDYRSAQQFYVYFHRPSDVSKMVFMVLKYLDKDDDRWLYLPALDLVKRIAASDKRTSFIGSDFLYEDVSGRLLEDDNHQLLEVSKNYYKLKHTPKNPANVEFAYFETYIHKTSFLPIQAIYYDISGQKIRTISATKVKNIQGFPTVVQSTAINHLTGSKTVMDYISVEYNIGLPKNIFSERYLRNAPKKHLR